MILSCKGQENSKWQRLDAVESNPGRKTKSNYTVDKSIDKQCILGSSQKQKKNEDVGSLLSIDKG